MSDSSVASNPVESEVDDKVEEEPVSETVQEPESEIEKQVEPAKSVASLEVDRSEIEAVVLEVVVEHTGYPEDFIELDQDLEGELGIDTVKQAEMMGDIRELGAGKAPVILSQRSLTRGRHSYLVTWGRCHD